MEQNTRALQGQDTSPVPRHCEPEQQRQRSRTTTAARPWVLRSLQHPGVCAHGSPADKPRPAEKQNLAPPAPSGPALFLQLKESAFSALFLPAQLGVHLVSPLCAQWHLGQSPQTPPQPLLHQEGRTHP